MPFTFTKKLDDTVYFSWYTKKISMIYVPTRVCHNRDHDHDLDLDLDHAVSCCLCGNCENRNCSRVLNMSIVQPWPIAWDC